MSFLRTLFLSLFLFIVALPLSAQNLGIDFENLRADQLSDEQIQTIYQRIQSEGLTVDQVEALAIARGMNPLEVAKLRRRLNSIQLSGNANGTGAQGNRMRTDSQDTLDTPRYEIISTKPDSTSRIFGADLFNNTRLTFEPSLNIPTPPNYVLGPGDELIIDIYGAAEDNFQLMVSPEGAVQISGVGPVYVTGLTMDQARERITSKLSEIYSGLRGDDKNTFAQIALGQIRSIKVNLVGEVKVPGTYTVSSLSTVFNALYAAGGPSKEGTFRAIKVIRGDETAATVDLYDFLVYGDQSTNIQLQDQDIIQVGPYENRITVRGETKRIGLFETTEGETFADLLEYAGGFDQGAYTRRVKIERYTDTEKAVIEVSYPDDAGTMMKSGDKVTVGEVLDRYENRVQIEGAVFREGDYELEKNPTLMTLITNADGLMGDAFMDRAVIYRTLPNYRVEAIAVNLNRLMEDPATYDVTLMKDDVIRVASIFDIEETRTVNIRGSVLNPGSFPYFVGNTLKDVILQANGFSDDAAPYNIEVARRIPDDGSGEIRDQIAEVFNMSVENGMEMSAEVEEFEIMPYDQIFIRQSPTYAKQQVVTITGEVKYPGQYVIDSRDYRIDDLIEKSGGLTGYAYPEGASLKREGLRTNIDLNVEEADTLELAASLNRVGIKLEDAINNPRSRSNLLLQQGDVINIPKRLETVQIRGQVLYPVNTRFEQNKSFRSYIGSAGGFTEQANTKRAYIVHANGEVDRTKRFLFFKNYPDVRPGSILIVPEKREVQRLSTAERITVMSTIVSLAAIVTNTIFQIRR
ncbi:SLBB domain-containing protein [Balneola sp. MJW-20]|uniref:SLBB domain-containing protein n=1 Tax=Gracilimonas aurantiaca TaxID=3234185 RepID=UPI00346705CD